MQRMEKAENTTKEKITRDSNLSRMPRTEKTQRLQMKPKSKVWKEREEYKCAKKKESTECKECTGKKLEKGRKCKDC